MSHVIDTAARLAWVEAKLRPYQLPSVRNLVTALSTHNGALDASDTGTGKTYVAAAAAYVLHRPLFVVCPKTIIPKWEAVGRKFRMKIKAMGYERLRMGYHSKILIIDEKGKFVWKLPPETIIAFDECHRLMHPETENSRIGIAAFRQGYTLLGLSATAADHPKKMKFVGTITKLFTPETFTDWLGTCKYKNRSSAVTAHMQRIHNHIFPSHGTRIRIADLGSAFPTTQIQAECYAVDGVDKINAIYEEMAEEIADIEERELQDAQKTVCILTARLRASQRAEILKVPAMVTIARDAMEEGKSVAIFLNFRNSLDALVEKLKLKCKIYGGQSDNERQEMLRLFQTDVERGIALNIRCGGIGLDLQGKNRLSLINPGLSSSDLKQVFGRVHRDGGEHSEQRIFFTQGTIEEENYRNVMAKIGCIDTLNDGDLSVGNKIRVIRSVPRPRIIVPPLPSQATTPNDVPPVIATYKNYQIT